MKLQKKAACIPARVSSGGGQVGKLKSHKQGLLVTKAVVNGIGVVAADVVVSGPVDVNVVGGNT